MLRVCGLGKNMELVKLYYVCEEGEHVCGRHWALLVRCWGLFSSIIIIITITTTTTTTTSPPRNQQSQYKVFSIG